jgi:DNA-binding helix-hairpin-helix protein with protein kinase domain
MPIMNELVDVYGETIRLNEQIGRGGEGSVYSLLDDDTAVAKIYHQKPLPDDQVQKLRAIVALSSDDLVRTAAWPRSLIYEPVRKQPCGILLPRVSNARHLHELYGTTSRRRHFAGVAWHHLVLAARNTAAAFHSVHAAGVVVGDVNQGNLMVDEQMRVRLIDCDSFQVRYGDQISTCPVGTPHFTPPELQDQQLRDVERTVDHDCFGLAVLIFHLLFVGRHPFAGRFRGTEDMPIEKAIGEYRFAFSRDKEETQMDPPPASLLLEDLPQSIGKLFERAFRGGDARGKPRPLPQQWALELEELIKHRKTCSFDPMHVFYAGRKECPWCRIEEEGGPTFFVASSGATTVTRNRLAELDARIRGLREVAMPDLSPGRLSLPRLPPPGKRTGRGISRVDVAAAVMGLAAVLAVVGVWQGSALAAATVLSLAAGGLLWRDETSRKLRQDAGGFQAWLDQGLQQLAKGAQGIVGRHRKQLAAFARSTKEVQAQLALYRAEGDQLTRILVQNSSSQQNEFLRNHLIRDHAAEIEGMHETLIPMLESFGIESAYDIEKIKLMGNPAVNADLMVELLQWRTQVERNFIFKPEHGVTPEQLKVATEAATMRYKTSQARKVLQGADHLATMAELARYQLKKQLGEFDKHVQRWRDVAKQYREFQGGRTRLERLINTSIVKIACVAAGIPLAGALLRWLFQ